MANQSLFEYLPLGYQSLDENGRILAVNQSWLDLLGYARDQVIGRWFGDLLEPQSAIQFRQTFPDLMAASKMADFQLEMRQADGTQMIITMDGRSEYDDQDRFQCVHCLIRDISKEIRIRDALRKTLPQFETGKNRNDSECDEIETSLQQLTQIINQSGVIVFLWQAKKQWPVEFVSDNIRQFGYDPEIFYKQQTLFADLVHPDDLDRIAAEVAHYSEVGAKEFDQEYRIITQSGEAMWVEDHTTVRYDGHGRITHFQGVVQDITAKKEAESALRASEARYRQMFESHTSIQWLVDPATQKIVDVNPAAARFYGYTREQMQQMAVNELNILSPEEVKVNIELAHSQNRTYFEMPHRLASGEVRLVEIYAGPIQINNQQLLYAVLHDITDRKEVEEALRKTNREMTLLNQAREALNSTLDLDRVLKILLDEVCFLLDAVAGSIWLVDPVANELVCRQVTEPQRQIVRGWRMPVGRGIAGWVVKNGRSLNIPDAQADKRFFGGVDQKTGLTTRSLLCVPLEVQQRVIGVFQVIDSESDRFNKVDLSLIETLASSAAVAVENARLHQQLADYAAELEIRVSHRTQELVHANEKLKELDELKTKLVEDISHELRTPVANLSLYLDLLERGKPEKKQQYMIVLRQKMDQLVHLTEDILKVFHLDLFKGDAVFENLDLNEALLAVIKRYEQPMEAAGLQFIVDLTERPLPVFVERKQMEQVLDNLLRNAIEYTPSGTVQVVTRLHKELDEACISVMDTGIGIASRDIPYIFDRFYRGRQISQSSPPGTGLGLSVVKDVISLHGGHVNVVSEQENGSKFEIWLPLTSV